MKISHAWLSDFIVWKEQDPVRIADAMTKCMGEVDDVEWQGALLNHTVVGKVLTVEKHPNADKLFVCTVETDQGTKTVVCGGTNVRTGMFVAFAHVGATVKWHGGDTMTLTKAKIRGVESEGMIAAQEELGLTTFPPKKSDGERPIVDLTHLKLSVGTPIQKALNRNDVIFHIDNHAITNRPDLFSHVGVARELVAMGLATWRKRPSARRPKFPSTSLPFRVKNTISNAVPHCLACALSIDSIGTTPDWMRARLEAIGVRSINLPVDITNYVSAELGMPLHSFDIGDISGNVEIRTSRTGEKLVTLDEVIRSLPEGSIVLSDDEGIFDLLGIMGGLRSSTKDSTKRIYLHAAIVDPVAIRRTVIGTNLRTDAATVYEKGIPFVAAETGFFRALELMLAHVPGARIASSLESWREEKKQPTITFADDAPSKTIGMPIKSADSKKILTSLGYDVRAKGKALSVTPPAWRTDVAGPHDVIEDIARIVGYNRIAPAMPTASVALPARDARLHRLRDSLKESGFFETVHLAFVSPDLEKRTGIDPKSAITVDNPLGEELSLMRTHLLPRLLETAAREERSGMISDIAIFEVGRTFAQNGKEQMKLALLCLGKQGAGLKDDPMLRAKDATASALRAAGYSSIEVASVDKLPPFAHPGRSGAIEIEGRAVGLLTTIHPSVTAAFGITGRAGMCAIDLDLLFAHPASTVKAQPVPEFPAVTFDETLPLKAGSALARAKAKAASSLLESIDVLDYFKDNVTLRFRYRSEKKTLTEDEAKKAHSETLQTLR